MRSDFQKTGKNNNHHAKIQNWVVAGYLATSSSNHLIGSTFEGCGPDYRAACCRQFRLQTMQLKSAAPAVVPKRVISTDPRRAKLVRSQVPCRRARNKGTNM